MGVQGCGGDGGEDNPFCRDVMQRLYKLTQSLFLIKFSNCILEGLL